MNIRECKPNDIEAIIDALDDFNNQKVPFTQDQPSIDLNFKIEADGKLVAGILACLYGWGCLHVSYLYVDAQQRGKGHGRELIRKVEAEAKKIGCHLIHLDTFDFQAKDFYLQEGFEVFGELTDCPKDHVRYYLKKVL